MQKVKFDLMIKNSESKSGVITEEDLYEIISLDEQSLQDMIRDDQANYKYGLSFNEYFYCCLVAFNKFDLLNNINKKKIVEINNKYYSSVHYIYLIDSMVSTNRDNYLPDFDISDDLLDALKMNMNPNYSTEERIIYYYFKLCFLLNADTKYNFCSLISTDFTKFNFKKSPNRLNEIDTINNEVICSEFNAILKKLIQLEGGVVNAENFFGTSAHSYTDAVINRHFYRFDAYEDPTQNSNKIRDIYSVKMNNGYNGIITNLDDLSTGNITHFAYIDKIYHDVEREFDWHLDIDKFNESTLNYCFDIVDNLCIDDNTKNKIKYYFNYFNNIPLTGVDYFGTIINHYSELNKKIDNDRLELVGVCSAIDDYDLSLILSVKDNNDNMIYFMFGRDDNIEIYTKEELTKLVNNDKIIVNRKTFFYNDSDGIMRACEQYRFIPGIPKQIQVDGNKKAEKNLLPKVISKIYKDSLGNQTVSNAKKANNL